MAYNPSIHTASNKPYGVTNKPVDARYWYYDSSLYLYRPYASMAEVLGYLIANDRKAATVQIGTVEYWWPDSNDLSDAGLVIKATSFEIVDIPADTLFESGQEYVRVNYAPYITQYGNNPTKWIEYFLSADDQEQKYIRLVNRRIAGVLTYIDVYADPNPSDPTKTADHLQLILK